MEATLGESLGFAEEVLEVVLSAFLWVARLDAAGKMGNF
jgi:hypothetical protein